MSGHHAVQPLALSFWANGAPVWAANVTPECAKALADWWDDRARTEYGDDNAAELRQLARRLRTWAESYEDQPDFRTGVDSAHPEAGA